MSFLAYDTVHFGGGLLGLPLVGVEHLEHETSRAERDLDDIAGFDFLCGLDALAVDLYPAARAGVGGDGAPLYDP